MLLLTKQTLDLVFFLFDYLLTADVCPSATDK